MIKPYNYMAKL